MKIVEIFISLWEGLPWMMMHRRKCSNEILPGVDLQILFLVEYVVVWYILFPCSEISSVDAVGSFL